MRAVKLCCGLGLFFVACGRSAVFFPGPVSTPESSVCSLSVTPSSLDFGFVDVGKAAASTLTFANRGAGVCHVASVALGDGSDPGFSLPIDSPGDFSVAFGDIATVSVAFQPSTSTPPGVRTGTLTFESDDPVLPSGSVSLSATLAGCLLNYPTSVDFGTPPLDVAAVVDVTLFNDGGSDCDVSGVALAAGSDAGFDIPIDQPMSFSVAPGAGHTIAVSFEYDSSSEPYARTGLLNLQEGDAGSIEIAIPLIAGVAHCELGISPPALDFGNILLNGSVTDQIILFNDGGLECDVSDIGLDPGTDADFSLPAGQANALVVPPGGQAPIAVTFDDLSGATEPFLRQGTLSFLSSDPINPHAEVPLSAYVNTACLAASRWIYTVDETGTFSQFDPQTLTFTDIGVLQCQDPTSPFSMAVDQNAVAWVLYSSGSLFQVSTADASCQATAFSPGLDTIGPFGMSFLFQPTTGLDTLYVVGTDLNFTLATIAFPSLTLTTVGPTFLGRGELAGTGDGELWDFVPNESDGATLAQLDPATGDVLNQETFPDLTADGDFAMKFWGGSFWIFVGTSVQEVSRTTGAWTTPIPDTGRPGIVGAGVSTCAPVQAP